MAVTSFSANRDFPERAPPSTSVRAGSENVDKESDPVGDTLRKSFCNWAVNRTNLSKQLSKTGEFEMALDGYSDQTMSRQAMRAELLDAETELKLAYAWRDQRDERALHRLITAYMRLAISMASKFRRYGAPMPDLIQEASLG
ncbi:MAG: hypothetical protein ACK4GC_15535, partial [Paracoccaceae bacterium]